MGQELNVLCKAKNEWEERKRKTNAKDKVVGKKVKGERQKNESIMENKMRPT